MLQVALGVRLDEGVVLYNDSTGRGGESIIAGRVLYLVLVWLHTHHTGFRVRNATKKVSNALNAWHAQSNNLLSANMVSLCCVQEAGSIQSFIKPYLAIGANYSSLMTAQLVRACRASN